MLTFAIFLFQYISVLKTEKIEAFTCMPLKKMVPTRVPLKRSFAPVCIGLNFCVLYAIPSGLNPIFTIKFKVVIIVGYKQVMPLW
jgi:hypothetical protein